MRGLCTPLTTLVFIGALAGNTFFVAGNTVIGARTHVSNSRPFALASLSVPRCFLVFFSVFFCFFSVSFFFFQMCALFVVSVLKNVVVPSVWHLRWNVFSYYRMCSLTIECVLSL